MPLPCPSHAAVGLEPVITALSPERSSSLAAVVDAAWPLLLHTTGTPPGSLTQEEVRPKPAGGVAAAG